MKVPADRRLRAMTMAKQCASLGGRILTIERITGLPARDFKHWLFPDQDDVPRGRPPNSMEWLYGRASLLDQAIASVVMSIYMRLRKGGFEADDALIGAYRHHMDICQPPYRISFDRAFDLASNIEGRWLAKTQSLDVIQCKDCGCDHLASYGTVASFGQGCPFCGMRSRYCNDPRLQGLFPASPLADAAAIQLGVMALMRTDATTRSFESQDPEATGNRRSIEAHPARRPDGPTSGLPIASWAAR